MLRNYFKIALRNLYKNKTFSVINIAGLAVSMSVCLLIILILADQYSYDQFHTHSDRIYRVQTKGVNAGWTSASSALPLGEELRRGYSGIERTASLVSNIGGNAIYKEKVASGGGYFADGELFKIFDFSLAKGDPKTALKNPFSLVISAEMAAALFGNDDPLGKTVQFNDTGIRPGNPIQGNRETDYGLFTITGVLQKPAGKTHLPFGLLASLSTLPSLTRSSVLNYPPNDWDNVWTSYTYVLLEKGKTQAALQTFLHQISARKYTKESPNQCDFIAEPLSNITLSDPIDNMTHIFIPQTVLWVVIVLGLIVMLSACLNYTNLSVARALTRAKEVGIRKVSGATREQIFVQFVMESVVFSLFSLVLAVGLLALLEIPFTGLWLNKYLNITFSANGLILLFFLAFSVVIGLVAGLLPSLYLSAFNPIQTLKNMSGVKLYKRHTLRKILLVVQFSVSLVFIISTVLLYSQLNFMMVQDYGFDKNNMVNIRLYKLENYQRFAQSIASHKNVLHTSASTLIPGSGLMQKVSQAKRADNPKDSLQVAWMDTDAGFVSTWGVKLLAGRSLPELPDTTSERFVMVTKKAVTDLKYASPQTAVGQKLLLDGNLVEIVGVVSDFQYHGLNRQLSPVVLRNRPKEFGYVNVRISASEPMATVAYLEKQWKKANPTTKFEYDFLDQQLLGFQAGLGDVAKILGFLSFLAVLISCLGLLGMAAYTAETRTKEIGIRKVLGASVSQIALLLSKSFLYLLLVAIVIATPIAYFMNNLWLEFFAYRVSMGPGILAIGVLIMVVISMVAIFSQTWRAARSNPVKSLRSE